MKRDLPPHISRKSNGLYYQRRAGKGWWSKKLAADFPSADFWAEYAIAERDFAGAKPAPVKGHSIAALIESYLKSKSYAGKAPRTQADYSKYLLEIKEILGDNDARKIMRPHIIRLRDENADRMRAANYYVQLIRILMEHAIDLGWRERNPAKGVPLLKSEEEGRKPWPKELIEAYRNAVSGSAEHSDKHARARLVFELCLGTGQRIADVLKMQWGDIDGSGINIRQNKTGKTLWIPFTEHLRVTLEAAPRRSVFILTNQTATGPWSYRGASQAVRKVRESIGALDYDIHALRHSTASELAQLGCDDDMIAAVTGMSKEMVAHYTAMVRQKVLALRAQERRK